MGTTVLVTGAGGPAGVSVIRALRAGGHQVIAADAAADAVGLRLADAAVVLPRADDDRFLPELLTAAGDHGVDALISTVAEELPALEAGHAALDAAGIARWLPDAGAVETCLDKWQFAKAIERLGVPAPATGLGDAAGIVGPWIVKPRFGRGSRDVIAVDDEDDLPWALRNVPDPIVQTRVPGREFTADLLVDRSGQVAACVPRWRLETKAGISTKGETFVDDTVAEVASTVVTGVGLDGPINLQGFVTDDGDVRVIEVNPRFSGGLPLSIAAGADLVGQYLRGVLGLPLQSERLGYRAGVRMLRHFEEVFEG